MRRRTDANQGAIVTALREAGCVVEITSGMGNGFPDLVVGYGGRVLLLEVKDGRKKPSARRLTPDEEAFHARWAGYPVLIVTNELQALKAVGIEVEVK